MSTEPVTESELEGICRLIFSSIPCLLSFEAFWSEQAVGTGTLRRRTLFIDFSTEDQTFTVSADEVDKKVIVEALRSRVSSLKFSAWHLAIGIPVTILGRRTTLARGSPETVAWLSSATLGIFRRLEILEELLARFDPLQARRIRRTLPEALRERLRLASIGQLALGGSIALIVVARVALDAFVALKRWRDVSSDMLFGSAAEDGEDWIDSAE